MESKFPLTFTQCPNCGGERRIANEVIQEQKDKGLADEHTQVWLFSHQSMLADTGRPHIQIPIVLSLYDACMDCGTVYCIRAEKAMGTHQTNPKTQSGPGFGRN